MRADCVVIRGRLFFLKNKRKNIADIKKFCIFVPKTFKINLLEIMDGKETNGNGGTPLRRMSVRSASPAFPYSIRQGRADDGGMSLRG